MGLSTLLKALGDFNRERALRRLERRLGLPVAPAKKHHVRLQDVGYRIDDRYRALCARIRTLAWKVASDKEVLAVVLREVEFFEEHRVTPFAANELWWATIELQRAGVPEEQFGECLEVEAAASELAAALRRLLDLRKRMDPNTSPQPEP